MTASQIKQRLKDTAYPLRDQASDPLPNDKYGFGLVIAGRSLTQLKLAFQSGGTLQVSTSSDGSMTTQADGRKKGRDYTGIGRKFTVNVDLFDRFDPRARDLDDDDAGHGIRDGALDVEDCAAAFGADPDGHRALITAEIIRA